MKKCLNILVSLSIAGFYFLNSISTCAQDVDLRIHQLERDIHNEEKALRALKKRYERIVQKKQKLQYFLEQNTQKEEQNKRVEEQQCCQRLKKLWEGERGRAVESALAQLKRREVKEKIIRELLEKRYRKK